MDEEVDFLVAAASSQGDGVDQVLVGGDGDGVAFVVYIA
jgi:hypothetical protein